MEACPIVFGPCNLFTWDKAISIIPVVRLLKYFCVYRLVCGHCRLGASHALCRGAAMRRCALANSRAWIVEWEWECTADRHTVVGGARCSSIYILTMCDGYNDNHWSHGNPSRFRTLDANNIWSDSSRTTTPQERSPK